MKTIAVCDNDRAELLISKEAIERYAEESGTDIDVLLFDDVTVCSEVAGSFDIVFMDIDFEGAPLGIEAVRRINEIAPNCQVVYLTNYLQYSLDVYVTDHVWYVLKSQFEERLPEIIRKISLIDETRPPRSLSRRKAMVGLSGCRATKFAISNVESVRRTSLCKTAPMSFAISWPICSTSFPR